VERDYGKIGFMCGVEIHQQVDTRKLFCQCPSIIRDEKPDFIVERRMRATAGEFGGIDPAALHEFLRGRTLHYEAYIDTNCLVELDEEPPHRLNMEALRVALEVAFLLKARPVEEVHVMRKTVIDGSNTGGFQRTMLVAVDGVLETSMGLVGISTVCLEEDAARIIGEEGGKVHYRLDRLGIPLVEIATAPDVKNPKHAREVAEAIGGLLRASRVKRGLGTIRQDINVSVGGGERVEVKGVQDLRLVLKVVEGEVDRQLMLNKARDELLGRGAREGDYSEDASEVASAFTGTESAVIRKSLDAGGTVLGIRLRHMEGLLKGMLGPQLAQYARAFAGVKGIFHGDELPAYGISPAEAEAVRRYLGVAGGDSYVIVAAPREQSLKALSAVAERCRLAFRGVLEETRRAKDDGSTEYMRPLPGSARMYPETDEPFVRVDDALLASVAGSLPELREDKAKRYAGLGLSEELARQISRSGEAGLFEELVGEYPGIPATVIAQTISATPKEAEKRFKADVSRLNAGHYRQMLELLGRGVVSRNVVAELLATVCEKPERRVEEVAAEQGLTSIGREELKALVARVKAGNPGLDQGQLVGKVMAETRGRADSAMVQEMVRSFS